MKKYAFICHDVSPVLGSEAGNAWSVILELENMKIECDIYCAATNQLGTENYKLQILSQINQFSHVNFNFVEHDAFTSFINNILKKLSNNILGTRFTYSFNYRRWLDKVECIVNNNQYEWIHLFNHISFRWPLKKLNSYSNYIWGPVSGTDTIKLDFFTSSIFQKLKYNIRNLLINQTKKSQAIRKFSQRCKKIYCVTKSDVDFFSNFSIYTEQQLDVFTVKELNTFVKSRKRLKGEKINFVLVGRIDELKGIDIAIEAIKYNHNVDLTIFGNGPLFEYFSDYLIKNKINNIFMRGSLPRKLLLDEYNNYDILLLPTLKEAGCLTVLEAMSKGLPVISHDAFGITLSVDSNSGWLIPYTDKSSSINKIKEIVSEILINPETVQLKSISALYNSTKFVPDAFVKKLARLFD